MISLGRRDARKELGLGFEGGREMDDTELEEGEACLDRNNNNDHYDASMDPDIALSYIDEKLQDVLGHFQKDFEGGVSAENLGAKFGGYGSFLPAYQRSPVWSHPRTPPNVRPNVQQYNGPRSPNNSQLEVGQRGSVSSLPVPQSGKPEPPLASAVLSVVPKATSSPAVANKQDAGMPSANLAKEHALRYESTNRKCTNLPEQKMLKFRIKVGLDNLSTQNNAAIYSGLGLDMSPSSSTDDSPSGSEGMFHGPQDSPLESPAHILRIMTCFPVLGGVLLSPLPGHLIHLTEKEKLQKGSAALPALPVCPENSGIGNGSDAFKADGKMNKLLERNETSVELKYDDNKDSWNGVDVLQKKEMDSDTMACEELISNTLKLPLLSNSYPVSDSAKGMGRSSNISRDAYKGAPRDKGLGPMNTHEDTWAENTKIISAAKIWEDKKSTSFDSVSVYPRKDGHQKGEKLHDSVKSDSNVSKGTKTASSELKSAPKQKGDQKVTSRDHEGTKFSSGKEHSSSEGRKKSKVNGNIVIDMPKDGVRGPASAAKNKKSTNLDNYSTKSELEDSKSQKNTGKAGDRYREFFGDIELDQEEKQMSLLEMDCEDRRKDFDMSGEKSIHFSNNTSRERPNGKKIDKLLKPEVYPKTVFAPFSVNGSISEAAPASAPAAAEDNWVCCDKCQKWRLLPLGKNPNDLPEKWLCSMLNWLPGMNRCSFSEEETTNAVMALNQLPALGIRSHMQSNLGGTVSTLTSVGNHDHNHQNYSYHAMPSGGKKKTHKDGPSPLNSAKKSIQVSLTNGSLNEVNQPSVSESDFQKPSKSSDLDGEKHRHKQKEKQKVPDNCLDGVEDRQSKVKSKRDSQKDMLRVSKKIKTEGLTDDWVSDPANIEKVRPSLSNGLHTVSSEKNLHKNNGHTSSEDQISCRKPMSEPPISMDGVPMDMGKQNDREIGKKRKINGSHDAQVNTGSFSSIGRNLQSSRILAKELSENKYRKEKKAKISRSDGKESSASKGSGKTDKKASHRKGQQLGQDVGSSVSQRSLDDADFLKRDSGSLHPSVAATSSSSKVSGSQKTKANFHDMKGSPVESVSSSPMRVSKQGGQKRCSDGEDDGGSDRSGIAKKEKTIEVVHRGSLEFSVHDLQDRNLSHSGSKAKQQIVPSPDVNGHHFANGGAEYLSQDTRHSSKSSASDQCREDDKQQENHYHVNGCRLRKSGKGSSSKSKDKNRNLNSELENGKVKVSDSVNEQAPSYEVKLTDSRNKIEERFGVRSDENENRYVDKKDSMGLLSTETCKKENQSKFRGHNGSDIKPHAVCNHDTTSIAKQTLQPDSEAVYARVKSPSLPSSAVVHSETPSRCPLPISGSHKGNGANISDSDNSSKMLKQISKVDHANGTIHSSSRDPLSNGHRARELDAPSPVKRDSSSQAATNALKEAKNLKHLADRLKNSGSNLESTRLYFEAALKFLHGASLLESGEMIQSVHVYSSTAKLCEFCAHEYEKSKDMAAAALAYKCTEVAYLRVIYSSHNSANKDRRELKKSLQMIPPGESPSSSASDVDNLNHLITLDKGPLAKGISSPQVTGSHVIAVRNRPNFVRLLNFAQDVNFAMEASRKSRIALAAATGETQRREGISSIKTALDFNFQDVEGLLHLVRLAIEAISR